MGSVAKVTIENESALPDELKADLGLLPGDLVSFDRQADGSYRIAKAEPALAGLRGIVKPRVPVTGALIDTWSRLARESSDLSDEA